MPPLQRAQTQRKGAPSPRLQTCVLVGARPSWQVSAQGHWGHAQAGGREGGRPARQGLIARPAAPILTSPAPHHPPFRTPPLQDPETQLAVWKLLLCDARGSWQPSDWEAKERKKGKTHDEGWAKYRNSIVRCGPLASTTSSQPRGWRPRHTGCVGRAALGPSAAAASRCLSGSSCAPSSTQGLPFLPGPA